MEKVSRVEEYISRVDAAIANAKIESTKLTREQFDMEGMSSRWNRILLNEIIKDNDLYLEVGVWRGSTFIAALYKNNPKYAVAIDNFSQFGNFKSEVISSIAKHLPNMAYNSKLIDADCFNLTEEELASIPSNINVYFYDGAHEAEDQKNALTYYVDKLADQFIYIVDDWNYEPARIGTRQGIEELGLTVHKEWILPSAYNGDTSTWWNGFYLAVCEKKK